MKLCLFIFFLLGMTFAGAQTSSSRIYYVEQMGSNSNTGEVGSPWQTVEYALAHVGDNAEIRVGPGHYRVNDGAQFAPFGWSYSQGVTVANIGAPGDVIISGPPITTGYDFKIINNIGRLTFQNITFENAPTSSVFIGSFGTGAGVHDLKFKDCIFNMGPSCSYLFVLSGYVGQLHGLTFTGCQINMMKESGVGILINGEDVEDVYFTGNTCAVKNGLIRLEGASNSKIDDNWVTVTGTAGTGLIMSYGNTGTVAGPSGINNSMSRNWVSSSGAKFAHLMGAGIGHSVVFDSNIITSGDIWVKLNAGSIVSNNVLGGTIEIKGATDFLVHGNSVQTRDGICILLIKTDAPIAPTYGQVINNYLMVTGTGKCYSMLFENLGAQVLVDYNILQGKVGDVLQTSGILTLEELCAAWMNYDIPTNDSNSSQLVVRGTPWIPIRK